MGTTPSRRLQIEDVGNVTTVRFTGAKTLDEQTSQAVGAELFELTDKMARRKLVLNFIDVEYLSSGALGVLITLHKKLRDVGGKLVLMNIDPKLHEVFEITKLNKLFEIAEDAKDIHPDRGPEN